MKDFKVIEVKRSIFEDNDADANRLREDDVTECLEIGESKRAAGFHLSIVDGRNAGADHFSNISTGV